MSKRLKRVAVNVVSLVMALLLIMVQAGCGGNSTQSSATDTGTTTSTGASSTEPAKETPVTLKILFGFTMGAALNGVQTDPVAKEIEKQTGVIMDVMSGNAITDLPGKISTLIATNDLPDLIYLGQSDLMAKAVSAKQLIPLDSLIEKGGQNFKQNSTLMLQFAKRFMSNDKNGKSDGNTYLLPLGAGVVDYNAIKGNYMPSIRWDLYKKLGYPKAETLADYVPIMQQLMKLEPTNKDGKKTYGMGAYFGDGQWAGDFQIWAGTSMYGQCPADNFSMILKSLDDTSFSHYLTDKSSSFYKFLDFFNKANRAGVLDPDSFTMKQANYTEKMQAGRYLFAALGSDSDGFNTTMLQQNITDKAFGRLPIPADSTSALITWDIPQGNASGGWAISTNCKYPEKAMKLLDYLASYDGVETIYNGVKGVNWDMVNGKPAMNQATLDGLIKNPDYSITSGVAKYSQWPFLSGMSKDPRYDTFMNLRNEPDALVSQLTAIDKEQCAYYNIKLPIELVTGKFKTVQQYTPEQAFMSKLPKDLQDKANKIDLYYFNNYLKMVLAKTDAEYAAEQDKFIKGVNDLGYETVVSWYNTERDRVLPTLKK